MGAISIEQRLRALEEEHTRLIHAIASEWEPAALKRRKLHIKDALRRLEQLADSRALVPAARVLGSGSEGRVLLGRALPSGEAVAMKCEPAIPLAASHLWREWQVTKKMGGARGFACARDFLANENVLSSKSNVLVLDLLGPSLDDLFWATRELSGASGLSDATVLALLYDALARLQHLSERGFSHRDIKPENLLMGRIGQRRGLVHVVDFGTSTLVTEAAAAARGADGERELIGTPRYASLSAHLGLPEVKLAAADVESLLFSMAALSTGKLPWDDCLDSAGRIRQGCAEQLVQAKSRAVHGSDTGWAGVAGTPVCAVLLTLMQHVHGSSMPSPADRGERPHAEPEQAAGSVDIAWARAVTRAAYCQLSSQTQICRTSYDWDALGISWPESDEEVASAVTLRIEETAAGGQVTVVGGVSLLTLRSRETKSDASDRKEHS